MYPIALFAVYSLPQEGYNLIVISSLKNIESIVIFRHNSYDLKIKGV